MTRLHINEIELGKEYFSVCCGKISTVKFTKIDTPKISVMYELFEHEEYLSDIGIKYENESYINDLNFITKTRKEAEDIINSIDYKYKLLTHEEETYILWDL